MQILPIHGGKVKGGTQLLALFDYAGGGLGRPGRVNSVIGIEHLLRLVEDTRVEPICPQIHEITVAPVRSARLGVLCLTGLLEMADIDR